MEEFVILHHQMPTETQRPSHWDLMLQSDCELLTWALESDPFSNSTSISVQRLPNHRLEYLCYEGNISGGRGNVKQVAKGHYHWRERQDDSNWLVHLVLVNGDQGMLTMFENESVRFDWETA